MPFLMCKHRVPDFELFKKTLREHAEAHAANGMRAQKVWRCIDDAQSVFFVFEVTDLTKAKAMLVNLAARAKAGSPGEFPEMVLVEETPF